MSIKEEKDMIVYRYKFNITTEELLQAFNSYQRKRWRENNEQR